MSKVRLKALMTQKSISRPKLAAGVGVSVSTVARWLRDGIEGTDLFDASKFLGCSASYLVGVRDTPDRPVYLREDQRLLLELYEKLETSAERRAAMNTLQEAHEAMQKERQSNRKRC